MLRLERLTIRYGRVAAVQDLTLEVSEGELVGLIGPNGAGKSTTLSAVSGLIPASEGRILFEGQPIQGESPEQIVRRGIALVPEGRQIFSTLSVAENLLLGLAVRRPKREGEEELERMLERFPVLRGYYRSSAGRLSGGEQQQLAIARALLSSPRLLLLDEPSLGLAPLVVDLVFETLVRLKEEGVTILLVEQNAARTVGLADRTYILRTGRLALSGTREELRGRADLAEAYLGF